jgi:hypothetical protein
MSACRPAPCTIRLEAPGDIVTEVLDVPNIGEAYDLCRQRLYETPGAEVAYLYVNEVLIHTMKRRS